MTYFAGEGVVPGGGFADSVVFDVPCVAGAAKTSAGTVTCGYGALAGGNVQLRGAFLPSNCPTAHSMNVGPDAIATCR